jgi:CHRD domain-containing protein
MKTTRAQAVKVHPEGSPMRSYHSTHVPRTALVGLAAALTLTFTSVASAKVTELYAKMTGAAEVMPKADGGSGNAEIKLNPSTGKVCWEFTKLKGIKGATASHIHKGAKGKAGPVVVPLGGNFKAKGCTTASKATVKSILNKPSAFYVNIHTQRFPAGAIRGQL